MNLNKKIKIKIQPKWFDQEPHFGPHKSSAMKSKNKTSKKVKREARMLLLVS